MCAIFSPPHFLKIFDSSGAERDKRDTVLKHQDRDTDLITDNHTGLFISPPLASFNMSSDKPKNPLLPMAAGCIAGGVEATAVWPMEFIKTQLQLQSKAKGAKLPYTGMISGLKYTVQTTGFFSLYRGLAPTLLGSIPKAGIRFGLNAVIKDKLRDENGKLTVGKNFVAGLGAGVTEALVIVAPVETVKTKCIELNMPFVKGFGHILKTSGIGGIYQGGFATALKQGSNQGLRFMWFNEYRRIITNDGEKKLTPFDGLLGGMSAGCFSTLGNNPFDVIKVCVGIYNKYHNRCCLLFAAC